ncbi:helicase [Heterostelium album PN500]|uniref:Helicase n=1 Tax=Heterostelium pallidum (strain ATCC 26659 / Pp 5 / PN500) TaxID=670386 RepID=D3B244_HETP5|nr:helicase [Heterostelium album PN500]EFA84419.1 helicase [Heterostelium album PN500]|eukprot:XP_020436533.1 helicase [Heterostelium album PN500]
MYGLSQETGSNSSQSQPLASQSFAYFDYESSQDDYDLKSQSIPTTSSTGNNINSANSKSPLQQQHQQQQHHQGQRQQQQQQQQQSPSSPSSLQYDKLKQQQQQQQLVGGLKSGNNNNNNSSNGNGNFDFMSSQNGMSMSSQLNFEDPEDMDTINIDLPDHACRYCGLHDPSTVVRCMHPSCGKWFCNGKGKTTSSHIVNHLVKAKHNEISLHSESPFGDTVLECYNCGCKNIFLLGFIPAKMESVVILLCRDPCAMGGKESSNWDLNKWVPLINSDRCFLNWLVKTPSEQDQQRARQITTKQITKLEEEWKINPNVTILIEQHGLGKEDSAPLPTLLRYEDAYQYQEIITPLIKIESEYEKVMRESLSQDNVSIRWDQGLSKKWTAIFSFSRSDYELKVVPGDELKLIYAGDSQYPEWESTGRVTKINDESEAYMEISLELYNSHNAPTKATGKFKIDMLWRSTSFDRMHAALKAFAVSTDSISSHLYHALLGHDDRRLPKTNVPMPTNFAVHNLPPLNNSQISAAMKVLKSPLSLIQGPPGTGKTVVSSFIVHHIVKHAIKKNEKVLVCAPSNVAIDQLTGKLHSIGLKVVRLCSKLREEVASPVEHLTLHHQVWQLDSHGRGELAKFKQLKDEQGELSTNDDHRYFALKRHAESKILKEADVIATTCVGAGDPRLSKLKFPYVLIDESTQASEPECLIPLMLGAKQVVLVGDHCQLGPVLLAKKVIEAGLSQSLFERLINLGHHPFRLTTQYRMHPSLSEFPSSTFYEGQLVNELSYKDRVYNDIKFPWPSPNNPMFFYNSTGAEEISSSGTSFINRMEASTTEKIVTKLLELGTKPHQIGIITPYEGQRSFLVNNMQKTGKLSIELYREIEVASVDSFQGREKDFIILSCVRSNDNQGIGFLHDPRRLNVALTRARYGLIILGNARVLSRDQLWNNLICHFKSKEVLVEGTIQNLKQSMVVLQKPKKLYGEGKLPVPGAQPTGFNPYGDYGQVDPTHGMNMVYGQKPPKYYDPRQQQGGQRGAVVPGLGGNPYQSTRGLTQGMSNMSMRQYEGSQSINGYSQQSSSQGSNSQTGNFYLPMSQSFPMSLNDMSQEFPNGSSGSSQTSTSSK